jgi:hypothetical protein
MRCRERERGSALLIVFLFAAFVAIMLYKEMPVMAFEAQRAKEQLLIDRGEQYKQAVKVYWTHFQGRYPPDINALEGTNNIRFLRHRYKDPLTGKDDWRLLHMAPGGMGLIDSKVNPPPGNMGQNGSNGQTTSTQGAFGGGTFSPNGFGNQGGNNNSNSISGPVGGAFAPPGSSGPGGVNAPNNAPTGYPGAPGANNGTGAPVMYGVPQRPPALAANAGTNASDPNDPNASNNANPNGGQGPVAVNPGGAGQQLSNGQSPTNPAQFGQAPNQANPNQPNNAVQQIYGMLANQGAPGQPVTAGGTPGGGTPPGQPGMPVGAFSPQTGTGFKGGSTFGSNNGTNTTLGGMFAGVASIAQGRGIKIINDQQDYSKWEFYFDPQRDNARGSAGGANQQNPNGTPNPVNQGNTSGNPNPSNTFGNITSAFNSNGSNSTAPNAATTPASPPPQQ